MGKQAPRVSICLPVYNGETYLGAAIESVLAQRFEDIELIISDNASTDGTESICAAAAAKDSRVRYARAEVNRGLAWNFNFAFSLARGKYACWIGHDDIMGQDYIARCVDALDRHPKQSVCFSNAQYIDENGVAIPNEDLVNPGEARTPSERFGRILFGICDPIFGVMRTDVLRQTRLHAPYPDSDRTLLAELGLRAAFLFLPERLFHRRMHSLRTTTLYDDRSERALIFDPRSANHVIGPWVRQMDLVSVIQRAPVSWIERVKCYRYIYWWISGYQSFLKADLARIFWIAGSPRPKRRLA